MEQLLSVLRKYWWVILIIIVVIFLIYYFYNKGKGSTVYTKPVQDVIGSTSPNNNPVGLSNTEIRLIVKLAHDDYDSYLKGITGTHDGDLYVPIAQMSDTDFGRAYNIWNEQYQSEDGKTMVGAIESLFGFWSGITLAQDAIIQKATRLGLK